MAIRVNGELVHDTQFIEAYRQLGGHESASHEAGDLQTDMALRRLAERRVAGRIVLLQLARESGISVSVDEVAALRASRWGTSSASVCGSAVYRQLADDLLLEKYCQWLTRHEPRPSRTEVEQYYQRHRSSFRLPERVRVAQIVLNVEVPAEEEQIRLRIEQAQRELLNGSAFSTIAEKYSDCGGKAILGWVTRGTMVPEFEEAVFAIKPGERTGIFRTIFGFHIATVLERKPEGVQPLEDLRPILARRILHERRERLIDATMDRALQTAIIQDVPVASAPIQESRP